MKSDLIGHVNSPECSSTLTNLMNLNFPPCYSEPHIFPKYDHSIKISQNMEAKKNRTFLQRKIHPYRKPHSITLCNDAGMFHTKKNVLFNVLIQQTTVTNPWRTPFIISGQKCFLFFLTSGAAENKELRFRKMFFFSVSYNAHTCHVEARNVQIQHVSFLRPLLDLEIQNIVDSV